MILIFNLKIVRFKFSVFLNYKICITRLLIQVKFKNSSFSWYLNFSEQDFFLEICSHFVEYEREKLFKTFLRLCSVMSHNVNSQFDALLSVLQDYKIIWNLESIIDDNYSANDKLCHMISTFFLEKKKICWNLIHHWIYCLEYIINLVIQSFLFSDSIEDSDEDSDDEEKKVKKTWKKAYWKIRSHKKLHNIIIHIHNSETCMRDFKQLTEKTISHDNSIRWNSWYLILKIVIEKTAATNSYTK